MFRHYIAMAVLALSTGCGGGGSDASPSVHAPTLSPEPCSRTAIEMEIDNFLRLTESDVDFALYLERDEGQSYSFERGDVTLQTSFESASTSKLVKMGDPPALLGRQ